MQRPDLTTPQLRELAWKNFTDWCARTYGPSYDAAIVKALQSSHGST